MVDDVDRERLRRLAELRPDGAQVLSLYLDRDPRTFASPRALHSEVSSVLDEAARLVDGAGLEHDALVAARADVERVREALLEIVPPDEDEIVDPDLDLEGARGLAIFACGPADVFEILKLPALVATGVALGDAPALEPLVRAAAGRERVAVAVVDRESARLFAGTADALEEVGDEQAARRHREVRSEDVDAHLTAVSEALRALLDARGFDVLLLGVRDELRGALEGALHPYVRERLAGEIAVDVSSATADDVRRAAVDVLAERREQRIDSELDRLRKGLARDARAAAGVEAVRSALEQRRVEVLLYEAGRDVSGLPEAAVLQDADVLVLDPERHPELGPHEGVGAVLRF